MKPHLTGTDNVLTETILNPVEENVYLREQLADAMRMLSRFTKDPTHNLLEGFICVNTERRLQKVWFKDIDWIQAERNYVLIYTSNNCLTVHQSISRIEALLPKNLFSRIHKSYIVANDKIDFIEKDQVGIKQDQQIMTLPLGAQFKRPFVQLFKQNLFVYSSLNN